MRTPVILLNFKAYPEAMGPKAVRKTRRKTAKAAAFGPADRKAATGVGAP